MKKENNQGCRKLIPVDPSDKNSEGWICGQYYDALKKVILCDECSKKNKSKLGKKNRAAGVRFELRVRKDLESKGWNVFKNTNNVDLSDYTVDKEGEDKLGKYDFCSPGKLIPAKHKFRGVGIPMSIGTGFPDFIAISEKWHLIKSLKSLENSIPKGLKVVFGIEVKSNGSLTKEERAKCKWMLENNIFSKILIARKGKKRGEIEYIDFDKNKK